MNWYPEKIEGFSRQISRMNREYHKWYSRTLGRDMELLIFGHGGAPLLVFPTSMGRFFEFEDRGMIEANRWKYESGQLQAFCIDSVDKESWYNYGAHPGYRVWRHMQYERYVVEEVLPLIRHRNGNGLTVTGASFGGYHAMNFALRHPDLISRCVCMSGAFIWLIRSTSAGGNVFSIPNRTPIFLLINIQSS